MAARYTNFALASGNLVYDTTSNLYIADNTNGIIQIVADNTNSFNVPTTFATLPGVFSIVLSADGNSIYAVTTVDTNLYQIIISSPDPPIVLYTGLTINTANPQLAVDSNNNFYYGNFNGTDTNIYQLPYFTDPASPTTEVLYANVPGLTTLGGLVFDTTVLSGPLYASDTTNGTVTQISSSLVITTIVSSGLTNPKTLAFKNVTTQLYVTDTNGSGSIKIYSIFGTNAVYVPSPFVTGTLTPDLIGGAFSPAYVYTFSSLTKNSVYKIPANTINNTVTRYIQGYSGQLVSDADNNIYSIPTSAANTNILTQISSSRVPTAITLVAPSGPSPIIGSATVIGDGDMLCVITTTNLYLYVVHLTTLDISAVPIVSYNLHITTGSYIATNYTTGDLVYTYDTGTDTKVYNLQDLFGSPIETLITTFTGRTGTGPLAVDVSGNIYVTNTTELLLYNVAQASQEILTGFTSISSLFYASDFRESAGSLGALYIVDKTVYDTGTIHEFNIINGASLLAPTQINFIDGSPASGAPGAQLVGVTVTGGGGFYFSALAGNSIYTLDYTTPVPYYQFAANAKGNMVCDTNNNLYLSYNLIGETGSITKIDPYGIVTSNFSSVSGAALTMNPSKTALYAITNTDTNLYQINLTTGASTILFQPTRSNPSTSYYPSYITTDSAGDVYYTDNSGGNYTGTYIHKITLTGFASQSLFTTLPTVNRAGGIQFDSTGNLYVCDYGNGLIVKVNPGGAITSNPWIWDLGQPISILFDSSANVYVTNQTTPLDVSGSIQVFNSVGLPISNPYIRPTGFAGIPTGATFDTTGKFYFSADAGYVYRTGSGPPPVPYYIFDASASGVIVTDFRDNVYVSYYERTGIQKIDIYGRGSQLSDLSGCSIAMNPSKTVMYALSNNTTNLYQVDLATGNSHVLFSGTLTNQGFPPSYLTTDSAGDVYYSDNNGGIYSGTYIHKISLLGTPTQSLYVELPDVPVAGEIQFDSGGNLYICDYANGRIIQYNGSIVIYITGLINPISLAFSSNGNLYVTDLEGTINLYNSTGSPLAKPYITIADLLFGAALDSTGKFYFSSLDTNTVYRTVSGPPSPVICFKEGSLILCSVEDEEHYIPIEHIQKGTLVRTALNGYKRVSLIGRSKLFNPEDDLRSMNRLYICKKEAYPELTEDLVVTGAHSLLVDTLTEEQKEKTLFYANKILVTDNKYRLMACLDERAQPYQVEGVHTIWHLALEHEDQLMNYGIYANGLLVETASKRMMRELSGMKLL